MALQSVVRGDAGVATSRRPVLVALLAALVLAGVLAGCAAGRAFRQGGEAARAGQWDAAVEYYRRALAAEPAQAEYRIALERAMREAARGHAAEAAAREAAGELSAALQAYRRSYALDASNGLVAARIAALQQTLRAAVEAARPPPAIAALREQARAETDAPLLDPASDAPLDLEFADTSLREILTFLGAAAGVNVTYDADFEDRPATVALRGVAFDEALDRILSSHGAFHAVLTPTTIVVVEDTPPQRAAYAPQVIRTFYVSHADVEELAGLVGAVVRTPQMVSPPQIAPHAAANSLTVRATAGVMGIVERVIAANDKPRAEVVIDVEILEVNRERAQRYGLDLSQYAITTTFSPEAAPGGAGDQGGGGAGVFNLNTISRGVSPADFYTAVPAAVVQFLEQDTHTRLVAQPQLRGQEGEELELNLGQEIPVPSTAFTPLVAGGAAFNPLTSFQYRPVGVIVRMTPRVTFEEEIVLDLEVENSTVGPPILVAGQSLPTFGTRRVATRLRLRDGESNLLAGLLQQEDRRVLRGLPGLLRLPVLRHLFGATDASVQETDIVLLLTPRIVRTQGLTQADVSPIHIGRPGRLGVTGPPPQLGAPGGEPAATGTSAAEAAGSPAAEPAAAEEPADAEEPAETPGPVEPVAPAAAPAPGAGANGR